MPRIADPEIKDLQGLIEQIACGQVSEEEGRQRFLAMWEQVSREPLYRKILRELFPSLVTVQ